MNMLKGIRVGVSGTGLIGRQVARSIYRASDMLLGPVLTRRAPDAVEAFHLPCKLTNSLEVFLAGSDVIVECSGDPYHAFDVVDAAFDQGLPVVTMNSEFHVTLGSYFVGRGSLTEAEGDQPGSLAALAEEAIAMGFQPMVYGNMKGYLNFKPDPEEMTEWARRKSASRQQIVSFTDGTKLHIEQTLVANGLGATLAGSQLLGRSAGNEPENEMKALGLTALTVGEAIVDYVIGSQLPPGIFLTASHHTDEAPALLSFKMGEGPFYVLQRPFHLCGLEVPKTIRRVLRGEPPLLHNSANPRFSVAAIAKKTLYPGQRISRGIGGFDVRGWMVALASAPDHVPIGLLQDAILCQSVKEGEIVCWKDVELPDTNVVKICRQLFAQPPFPQ